MGNFVPISQLPAAGAITGAELVPLVQNGATCQAPVAQFFAGVAPYSLQVPLTGFTIQAGAGVAQLILNPAGTLASGTVNFPLSPTDNQSFAIASSQIITALSLTATAATISNAVTTLAAGGFAKYLYSSASTTWFRIG